MTDTFFSGRKTIEVRAVFLGQRLNMKALQGAERLTISPFVLKAGTDGYAVIFRYGVAVFFGMNVVEEAAFVDNLDNFVIDPVDSPTAETVEVIIDPTLNEAVEPDCIRLQEWDMERLQLVADTLAKTVVLHFYENHVAEVFDKIEPIAEEMQNGGPKGSSARSLLKHIGYSLSIHRKMIAHVEIEGKPELLWDRPDLERLYVRLEEEYEVPERHTALKNKLDLIHRTAETMLGILQEKRTLHVEWYIVILILVEIVISLLEKL